MTPVSYTLLIDGLPASEDLLAALRQIEVEEHAALAGMLRLQFAIGVQEGGSSWRLVDDGIFERLTNIRMLVTVGANLPETLIDAYVIEVSADFSSQPGASTLDVVAMDASVLMNLEEKVRPWPNMSDSDIAALIFAEYGLIPVTAFTQPFRIELDQTVIQRGTDLRFLRQLAARNGYECYVETNLAQLSEGHFHPPLLDVPAQGVLTVGLGASTNVTSFKARYEMLRPTTAQVTDVDVESQSNQSADVSQLSLTAFGSRPVLNGRSRRTLLAQTGLTQTDELTTYAQAVVDRSAWAVVAEGTLSTLTYEGVLRARRPVQVRGVGPQFSGTYYVEKVQHVVSGDRYTQHFTLHRNALGLTGREGFTPSLGLP